MYSIYAASQVGVVCVTAYTEGRRRASLCRQQIQQATKGARGERGEARGRGAAVYIVCRLHYVCRPETVAAEHVDFDYPPSVALQALLGDRVFSASQNYTWGTTTTGSSLVASISRLKRASWARTATA